MDHEIQEASTGGGGGNASARFHSRDLRSTRFEDHERACVEGSSAFAGFDPTAGTISRLVQWLKGKTAHKIMQEFAHIKKHFWGQHMWARGYFCCSTGNVTDEVIAEYIAHQQDDRDDNVKVDG